MKISMLACLFLSLSLSALAAEPLTKDISEAGFGISTVDKIQVLRDSQIDFVKVLSLANGPAMNPESVAIMLLAEEQEGDVANFDVYRIQDSYGEPVRSARIVGDFLVLLLSQDEPDDSHLGFKTIQKTVRVQIKSHGKRLPNPIVVAE